MSRATMDAREVIERLGLRPHPEGGWYAETWRADDDRSGGRSDGRAAGSAIFFLLRAGERSAWHRIDAAEIWHHYAGAPLELRIAPSPATGDGDLPAPPATAAGPQAIRLGDDLAAGEVPQAIVPAGAWQSARALGDWTLVGCTVSPAFEFEGFELAPDGWEP